MVSVTSNSAKRPVITLSWSGVDRAIEIAALLALIAVFALPAAYWPHLPERVPTKFGLNGEIKSWGDRNFMLLLPLTALATYVGLTILGRFPHRFNYPVAITPENAERHYRLGRWTLASIKLAVLLLLATVTLAILHSAANPDAASAIGAVLIIPIVLFMAFVLALVIVTIVAHRRIERQLTS
jgi:uncharacterized membrane protein